MSTSATGTLSGQTLPFYKNFFAGGVGSVRGYDTASLGPVDPLYPDTRLGGTRKAVFNSEILMPFPGIEKSFRFGPFFDAGNALTDNYTYAEEGLRPRSASLQHGFRLWGR